MSDNTNDDEMGELSENAQRLVSRAMASVRTMLENGDVPVVATVGKSKDTGEWMLSLLWPITGDVLEITTSIPESEREAEQLLRKIALAYMLAVGWIDKHGQNTMFSSGLNT